MYQCMGCNPCLEQKFLNEILGGILSLSEHAKSDRFKMILSNFITSLHDFPLMFLSSKGVSLNLNQATLLSYAPFSILSNYLKNGKKICIGDGP